MVAALGAVAIVVLCVRVVRGGDADGWLGLVLAALGVWVVLVATGRRVLLSAALLAGATWFAGRGLWSPEHPVDAADRLLGTGLPGADRYATVLLLALGTLGAIAAGRRHRTVEPDALRRPVVVLAVGAVLAAGAWLGGGLWAGRTAAAVLADTEDRTTAAEAPDPRREPPRGPEAGLAPVWRVGEDVRYGDQAALVPGTDLAVLLGFEAGLTVDYGLFVLDAETGAERWHYRIRSTENTSPGGFTGVVVGTRTGTLLAVVSEVAILFDLDTGEVRSRFALPAVPGEARYRVLSGSPVRGDRAVIQLSGGPVGHLAAHGEGVARLLSVDLESGAVRTADRAPGGACHYQYAGPSTEDGAFVVRSGRECGPPAVLAMTRDRVAATFDLPAVEQEATTCAEPDCDGPAVSVAGGRLVVDVGRELHAFAPDRPLWTAQVAAGARVTAVGPGVVVETGTGTTVLDGGTGDVLRALAPLPGTGHGSAVTPDTGWYRLHRLDDRTVEVVRLDPGSLAEVARSEPVPCGTETATATPPVSAASGRLLVNCWVGAEAAMTVLGR